VTTPLIKTPKQRHAISLMAKYIEVLLVGGSRSGKTFICIYAIFIRAAKYPGSKHVIVRKAFNHAKLSLWHQTIPDVLKIAFPNLRVTENKTDWFLELDNKSQIWIGGTDDKDRVEKILGSEWDTIMLNEISQMTYNVYETFKTRLNPQKGIKALLLMDQNPPSMSHWSYIRFHTEKNPENKQPLSDKEKQRQFFYKMNPSDNLENISESYMDTLASMSESKRRRFLDGDYGDDAEGALWRREWIIKGRIEEKPESLQRIVVGVDPAVTGKATSDDTGIIVAGKKIIDGEEHYYVLSDRTYHGDVSGWGAEVAATYSNFSADCVVGEVNQGGDLVEMNIRNYDRHIKYKPVRASRGKAVRAEPVADLYRRGFVHHVGEYVELEDQMCTWSIEAGESPNNMDALVWAMTELSQKGSMKAVVLR
jgi:phage terminase large subunit-like protein